ncbi:hypothetical protein LEP1GSC088_0403 [Leptospira interrogans str. L1207]|nr:hypothetical protein LEP1GSC088_0403 [Leptospira interrogans str. L1207]
MPGIGMITSLAIKANSISHYDGSFESCIGDCKRFSSAKQAAWSLVRCQHGGKVKEFYQRLYLKKDAKKIDHRYFT